MRQTKGEVRKLIILISLLLLISVARVYQPIVRVVYVPVFLLLFYIFQRGDHTHGYNISIIYISSIFLILQNIIAANFHLLGRDIHTEYYISQNILNNHFWDPNSAIRMNSLLSVGIFAPVFTQLVNLSLENTYALLFPIIFSTLTPIIYLVCIQFGHEKHTSVFSSLLFSFSYPFYLDLLGIARQQLAMVYLGFFLFVILLDIKKRLRLSLLVIFLTLTIVSHYGTALLLVLPFLIYVMFSYSISELNRYELYSISTYRPALTVGILLLVVILTYLWYSVMASGVILEGVVLLIYDSLASFGAQTTSKDYSQIATSGSRSVFHNITKLMYFFIGSSIGIGTLYSSAKISGFCRNNDRYSEQEYTLTLMSIGVLSTFSLLIIMPFFGLEFFRVYQTYLIVLAPFAFIPFKFVSSSIDLTPNVSRQTMFIFISIFLLFNCGFVYHIFGVYPNSPSITGSDINQELSDEKYSYYNFHASSPKDIVAVKWFKQHSSDGFVMYSGSLPKLIFKSYGGYSDMSTWGGDTNRSKLLTGNNLKDIKEGYLFYSHINTQGDILVNKRYPDGLNIYNITDTNCVAENKIYGNNDSVFCRIPV